MVRCNKSDGTYGACACFATDGGGVDGGGADASVDSGTVIDSTTDVSDAVTAFDAACVDAAGLGGIVIPSGTVATATASYTTYTPDRAIDGDMSTVWNSGGPPGSITLTFPYPVTLDGVIVAADANPRTTETYKVYGGGPRDLHRDLELSIALLMGG